MEPDSIIGAIGHIVGAFIVLSVLGIGWIAVAAWESERNKRAGAEDASLELGIPVDQLEDDRWRDKVMAWAVSRSSSELLRNRLSDLCGVIRTAWSWVGFIAQWGVLITAVWLSFTDDPASALLAWLAIPVMLFFAFSSVLFSYACKVLTGRFPGQARTARKALAQLAQQRR